MIPGQDRHSWCKAVARSELAPQSRLIAHTIAVWTDPTGGQGVWLSPSELATLTGLSPASVRRYLRSLYEAGWLHGGERGVRFLTFPGELKLGDVVQAPR